MNVPDFTYLLQHPDKVVSSEQTNQLEDVLNEYPYFQAARALHLKGLRNLNSFKYNNALKLAAAYTTDRDILFDYITSEEFLQNDIADRISGKATPLAEIETTSEEIVADVKPITKSVEASTEDQPLPLTVADAETILDPELFEAKKTAQPTTEHETLEIGEPLPFTKREKHSFSEWLQLASLKTIKRKDKYKSGDDLEPISFPLEEDVLKHKKFELIDKFIAENPKIVPTKDSPKVDISSSVNINQNELMTETLARVYVEQKKYKKALQAYKILSLKYPEKSGFFADRIKAVEKIQKENS
ncbi:hypothetical protein FGM00_00960 [Aggregatimonas sangjinii]|uniref:Tetratricopeptide repeat protein n=1 Tax=Aggregatimonas sangjinii TaxID=2583587 RepID=A0A5B7SJZ7_9FLAO|nr:hypothetical protein [Aggregatimonas sangjinii]QCW98756.1 hypothetical protein FGM00_00960 [Aggregatimonas sangjinii]